MSVLYDHIEELEADNAKLDTENLKLREQAGEMAEEIIRLRETNETMAEEIVRLGRELDDAERKMNQAVRVLGTPVTGLDAFDDS